ncbi:unnamed protein product [Schistocephalus solidus]|uniref:Phospholipase D3 n=1 Tax=Schistocephalus solidus TaxID=70667 RepID=A0A0X3NR73_SCHSO|nr:unnamed protein product [Schistocephalus solidus]
MTLLHVFFILLAGLAGLIFAIPTQSFSRHAATAADEPAYFQCSASLVESIPENLTYNRASPSHASTYFVWNLMINLARRNLTIGSYYWSLLASDVSNVSAPSAYQGEDIFRRLVEKSSQINVTIVQNGKQSPNNDLDALMAAGAKVQWLDVERLLGEGIQHAKLWSVDGVHAYLGSANMDWRSLTQVKELGIFLFNCPELVGDLEKVLLAFRTASGPNVTLPLAWPEAALTKYNRTSPMPVMLNGAPAKIYITMSPPPLTPPTRNDDLDAILHIIQEADSYIYVSVMAYAPAVISYSLSTNNQFWPIIDDALRSASLNRKVEVRLLISHWRHTPASLGGYLSSLRAIHGINGARLRVRYFVVPAFTEEQRLVPFGRVNHNKYMVTDKTLYIGTSNWSGDYFYHTGGAAFVAKEEKNQSSSASPLLREQLTNIFYRDWNSEYTQEL